MKHRISIKDTPQHLKDSLYSAAFSQARKQFPPGTPEDVISLAVPFQPEVKLDDIFWIADDITDIIFDASRDESMPEKESGESWLDLTRNTGVLYETGTGIFTVDTTGAPQLWRRGTFGDVPPVCEVLGFVVQDARLLLIFGQAQQAAASSPAHAPKGTGTVLGIPERPGEVPRVPAGGRFALAGSDVAEACMRLVEATFLLMGDSSLTSIGAEAVTPKVRRKHGKRRSAPGATVRTVQISPTLRKQAVRSSEVQGGREDREEWYSHQFVVRGHWRNVAYGEGRSKRRLRWIMPFLKGPEGTPVIRRPLVRVWR